MWSLFRTVSFIFLYRKKSVFKDWGLRSKHTQIKVCTGLKNTLLLCAAFKMLKDFKNLKPGLVILCKFDSVTMQAESDKFIFRFLYFSCEFHGFPSPSLGKSCYLPYTDKAIKYISFLSGFLSYICFFVCLPLSFSLMNTSSMQPMAFRFFCK